MMQAPQHHNFTQQVGPGGSDYASASVQMQPSQQRNEHSSHSNVSGHSANMQPQSQPLNPPGWNGGTQPQQQYYAATIDNERSHTYMDPTMMMPPDGQRSHPASYPHDGQFETSLNIGFSSNNYDQ